jgi:hypothetical protein
LYGEGNGPKEREKMVMDERKNFCSFPEIYVKELI